MYQCFNSQRDGILRWGSYPLLARDFEFQFPTGWNSTGFFTTRSRHSAVSIPNGMEFYSARGDNLVPPNVSIPNGMEFYSTFIFTLPFFVAFQFPTGWNSTSTRCGRSRRRNTFQFPTGWNSTNADFNFSYVFTLFQFPTGWNSTIATPKTNAKYGGFNSQRDGILRGV